MSKLESELSVVGFGSKMWNWIGKTKLKDNQIEIIARYYCDGCEAKLSGLSKYLHRTYKLFSYWRDNPQDDWTIREARELGEITAFLFKELKKTWGYQHTLSTRCDGLYECHQMSSPIYAIGNKPEDAINAWCIAYFGMEPSDLTPLNNKYDSNFEMNWSWCYTFVCDGTSFKAGGINIPGGVVMTWWE